MRWGFGDALLGWLIAQVGGVVASASSSRPAASTPTSTDDLSLGWIAVAQVGLWTGLLGVPWFAARPRATGWSATSACGSSRWDAVLGTGVGSRDPVRARPARSTCRSSWLFDVTTEELAEPARELTDRATDPVGVMLLVLIVGIGAPIVEEIFYRGLRPPVAREPLRRVAGHRRLGGHLRCVHFQPCSSRRSSSFGVVLAYLAHRTGRLGPAIVAHMAFNLVTVVVSWSTPADAWRTTPPTWTPHADRHHAAGRGARRPPTYVPRPELTEEYLDTTRVEEQRRLIHTIVDVVVVAVCVGFVLWHLQPDLLLRNTTPAGGDMGAHVWGPAYLRDHLLPQGSSPAGPGTGTPASPRTSSTWCCRR